MDSVHGFGLGVASRSNTGETLDVFYPAPLSQLSGDLVEVVNSLSGELDASALNALREGVSTGGCGIASGTDPAIERLQSPRHCLYACR